MEALSIIANLRVSNTQEIDERLSTAVDAACRKGRVGKLGVLVTRHAFDHFSVSLTSEVPFGTIREQDHA